MKNVKLFRKSSRVEISVLSILLEQLEYKITCMRGRQKLRLHDQLRNLKRTKERALSILLLPLSQGQLTPATVCAIEGDIRRMRSGCKSLKEEIERC